MAYNVTLTSCKNGTLLKCSCKTYALFDGICSHMLAVTEKRGSLNLFQTSTQQQNEIQTKHYIKLHQREQVRSVIKKTWKGKNNVKMQPLTDVFKLEVLDYELDELDYELKLDKEKKAAFGKYWHNDEDFMFI